MVGERVRRAGAGRDPIPLVVAGGLAAWAGWSALRSDAAPTGGDRLAITAELVLLAVFGASAWWGPRADDAANGDPDPRSVPATSPPNEPRPRSVPALLGRTVAFVGAGLLLAVAALVALALPDPIAVHAEDAYSDYGNGFSLANHLSGLRPLSVLVVATMAPLLVLSVDDLRRARSGRVRWWRWRVHLSLVAAASAAITSGPSPATAILVAVAACSIGALPNCRWPEVWWQRAPAARATEQHGSPIAAEGAAWLVAGIVATSALVASLWLPALLYFDGGDGNGAEWGWGESFHLYSNVLVAAAVVGCFGPSLALAFDDLRRVRSGRPQRWWRVRNQAAVVAMVALVAHEWGYHAERVLLVAWGSPITAALVVLVAVAFRASVPAPHRGRWSMVAAPLIGALVVGRLVLLDSSGRQRLGDHEARYYDGGLGPRFLELPSRAVHTVPSEGRVIVVLLLLVALGLVGTALGRARDSAPAGTADR